MLHDFLKASARGVARCAEWIDWLAEHREGRRLQRLTSELIDEGDGE